MFVLKSRYEFASEVKVRVPTAEGKYVEETFKALFHVVPSDEAAAVYGGGRSVREGDTELLRKALIGWHDMVDEKNKAIEFSEEMRDRVLGVPFIRAAIGDAYGRAIAGQPSEA